MQAPIPAIVNRRAINNFAEHRVDDPNFVKNVNPKESTVLVELSYLTNPERLVGNAKHYFDVLNKNGLFKSNGVLLFSTKSNLNIKNKGNIKNQLKTFILEDCFLNILSQSKYIEQIENLVAEIENAYRKKLDDNIKTFAQNALDFECSDSLLTLTVVCSSYASTYGELSTFRNSKPIEKPVQLELGYSFTDDTLTEELQYCRVRFEAPKFIAYLKTYSTHFLQQIEKVQNMGFDDFEEFGSFIDDLIPSLSEDSKPSLEEEANPEPQEQPTKPKRGRRH